MEKIKVMSVFGTRPEAIKMAPLVKALEKEEQTESIVCVTAQHREMLDQVLRDFDIAPNYDLNIMKAGQTLEDITVRALTGIGEVIRKVKPDIVLVHGDTTTTFASSLAAFYNQTKIGHVEAGLRTYDKYQPFPEEMNRKLTGAMADLHFSPTQRAKDNLLKENVDEKGIFITGNTAIDALKTTIDGSYVFTVDELNNIDYKNKKVITVTAHRRENPISVAISSIVASLCSVLVAFIKLPEIIAKYLFDPQEEKYRIRLITEINELDKVALNQSYQKELTGMTKGLTIDSTKEEKNVGVAGTSDSDIDSTNSEAQNGGMPVPEDDNPVQIPCI